MSDSGGWPRNSVAGQRCLNDFPWIHRRAGDRAPEEILDGNQAMPAIQMQQPEYFVFAGAQVNPQKFTCQGWSGQDRRAGSIALRQERMRAVSRTSAFWASRKPDSSRT